MGDCLKVFLFNSKGFTDTHCIAIRSVSTKLHALKRNMSTPCNYRSKFFRMHDQTVRGRVWETSHLQSPVLQNSKSKNTFIKVLIKHYVKINESPDELVSNSYQFACCCLLKVTRTVMLLWFRSLFSQFQRHCLASIFITADWFASSAQLLFK